MKYIVLALLITMMVLSACTTQVANEDIPPSDDLTNSQVDDSTNTADQDTPALPEPPSETPSNPEDEAAGAMGTTVESTDDEDIDGAMDSLNELEDW